MTTFTLNDTPNQGWVSMAHTPFPVCWLKLTSGMQLQARYAAGDWETMDGQWIKPSEIEGWLPLYIQGLRGVYE